MDAQPNSINLRVEDIQYLPLHKCPKCGAAAKTTEIGAWLRPYQDWYGTVLRTWQDHLGYVYFRCHCQHHPEFSRGLRVARLGDAILPVHFVGLATASLMGLKPAEINAEFTQEAVIFLATHADPLRTAGSDWLAHTLYALAAGGISPEAARRELQAWLERQMQPQDSSVPISDLVDLCLPD